MSQIVFIDDESNILNGLRRMLRPMRNDWDMHFFTRGREAYEFVSENQSDVVVSDMRMPEMDGVELLSKVKATHPDSIRIALSGQADASVIYRCINYAHQYLSKPCAPELLTDTVRRAVALRSRLCDPDMRRLVSEMSGLPSQPGYYSEVMGELESRDGSLERVSRLIESDMAMSAKVLQLVNSAYFGAPSHISSPAEAAMFLGLDVLKVLALTFGLFGEHNARGFDATELDTLWNRSVSSLSLIHI